MRIVTQTRFPKMNIPKLKRVAAYARVSSGKDAMLHSLSAQVSYYSELIQKHSGWQYVGVYADEALTELQDTDYWRQPKEVNWQQVTRTVVVTENVWTYVERK